MRRIPPWKEFSNAGLGCFHFCWPQHVKNNKSRFGSFDVTVMISVELCCLSLKQQPKTRMSRRKRRHLRSPRCIDSHPFRSLTIGPPIPEIQFDLENSRSKAKDKSTPVSTAPCWLISLAFHIRASYRLQSPSFHDIWVSHSRDTIWPWQFKVKGQGQRYPVSAASRWLISLVFRTRASYPLPSLSFHANQASHSWDTIWPYKFKVKGQGQRYPSQCSQCSVQLTHFLGVSHQGILSTRLPFLSFHANRGGPHSRDTIWP